MSLPIALQNIFSTAVSSADTVMIGMINQNALSAVSLANQIRFVMNLIFLGLTLGISLMTAQYWGRKDMEMIEKILGLGLKIGITISAVWAIGACFLPEPLMKLFTNEEQIISYGVSYLRIVGISYLFVGITQVYEAVMKAVKQVRKSTMIVSTTLILNVILNALFIFGWFGIPKMGVVGVALGTLLSRMVELMWCLWESFIKKTICIKKSCILEHNKQLIKDFWKYALPITCNGLVFGSSSAMYSMIMGHLGSDVVAANSIAVMARSIAMVGCSGLSGGAGIYLGALLGSGRLEDAKKDATKIFRMTLILSAIGGCMILLARPFLVSILELTLQATKYLEFMLIIMAGHTVTKAVNVLISNGINCSGGDTLFGLLCDTIALWGVMIPVGLLCAFVFRLSPMIVYGILCLDELIKIPFMYKRYKTYRWVQNITK